MSSEGSRAVSSEGSSGGTRFDARPRRRRLIAAGLAAGARRGSSSRELAVGARRGEFVAARALCRSLQVACPDGRGGAPRLCVDYGSAPAWTPNPFDRRGGRPEAPACLMAPGRPLASDRGSASTRSRIRFLHDGRLSGWHRRFEARRVRGGRRGHSAEQSIQRGPSRPAQQRRVGAAPASDGRDDCPTDNPARGRGGAAILERTIRLAAAAAPRRAQRYDTDEQLDAWLVRFLGGGDADAIDEAEAKVVASVEWRAGPGRAIATAARDARRRPQSFEVACVLGAAWGASVQK